MAGNQALFIAMDLARVPTLAELIRQQPLPPDILALIRIAADCPETSNEAAQITGINAAAIKEAAVLYLQQVLLAPDSDSYRILGVSPNAPSNDLREHMRWLMKWLHPDHRGSEWEAVFAERVLSAWNDVNSAERRQEYDLSLHGKQQIASAHRPSRRRTRKPPLRLPWAAKPIAQPNSPRWTVRPRMTIAMLSETAMSLFVIFPNLAAKIRRIGNSSAESIVMRPGTASKIEESATDTQRAELVLNVDAPADPAESQ